MTAVPLTDEQADRIEAGERPPIIGASSDLRAALGPASNYPVPVTFTRPCPNQYCSDGYVYDDDRRMVGVCEVCGSGRVPVTVPCPECHGRGLADVRGAPPCRRCGNGRARGLGRIPVEASVVHVIPAADVVWRDDVLAGNQGWHVAHVLDGLFTPRFYARSDLRWWVEQPDKDGNVPTYVVLQEWKGDGR